MQGVRYVRDEGARQIDGAGCMLGFKVYLKTQGVRSVGVEGERPVHRIMMMIK